jgi:glycosyltransferase involved in cell wall biosynthesis
MAVEEPANEAMVLLLGNYPPDQQQSMQRFSAMMLEGLRAHGVEAELVTPRPILGGNFRSLGGFVQKWLGNIDKYLLFPRQLRQRCRRASKAVVHICDHSNAVYLPYCRPAPVVVTCHDLLAVRGGLGEDTDCPASFTGRLLQKSILNNLRKAEAIACSSRATAVDANRLLEQSSEWVNVVQLGLSYPYRQIAVETTNSRLATVPSLDLNRPFALHVGSNLRRKNRDAVLRIVAGLNGKWNGQIVFVGEPLNEGLLGIAAAVGVADRVVQVSNSSNEILEALYNRAVALLYPSRFEGFGWPIIEAQACGCPVICSDSGPLPEVAGEAGLFHPVENEAAFAADLIRLTDPAERSRWSEKGLVNAKRFSTSRMIDEYIAIYRRLGAAV